MAYSVDWIAKVFTIPQSDLTFLSGNNYSLSLVDVHNELRRLEWAFIDGLWALSIAKFYETVTLSGVPKSPSVEIINGYTFNFTGSNYNVILEDYDNNLLDVYIPSNGISILGNNSVGRQTVVSGSGVTEQDKLDIANRIWIDAVHYDEGSKGHLLMHSDYIEHTVFVDTELAPVVGEGTELEPFGVTSNAVDFAELHGFRTLGLLSDFTVDRLIKNFRVAGIGGAPAVDTNGQNLDRTTFYQVRLSGEYTGSIIVRDSEMSGGSLNGFFNNCAVNGEFNVPNGGSAAVFNSNAIVRSGFVKPTFSVGGVAGTATLEIMKFAGGLGIKDCNQPTDDVKIENSGLVELDSSCTDGVITIVGNVKPIDNSGPGCTVNWYSIDPEHVNKSLTLPQYLGLK